MGIAFFHAHQLGDHRRAVLVGNAFGNSDRAKAVFRVNAVHIGQELLGIEGALRQIDEVRAVIGVFAGHGGGSGEEAGMAPHHHSDVNALERTVVEIHAHERLRHITGGRAVARAVVVFHQVVVDGLRNVDGAQLVIGGLGLFVDDAHGVRRIIAANVEEVTDVVGLHHLEHAGTVFLVGLVAGGKQAGGRCIRHLLKIVGGLAGEIHEVFLDDAAHAVDGAVNRGDLGEFAGLEGHAHDALVDHMGGAAALGDQNFSFETAHSAAKD